MQSNSNLAPRPSRRIDDALSVIDKVFPIGDNDALSGDDLSSDGYYFVKLKEGYEPTGDESWND